MEYVMKVFATTGAQSLPVVDVEGALYGYISRTRLFNMYRQLVADYSEE